MSWSTQLYRWTGRIVPIDITRVLVLHTRTTRSTMAWSPDFQCLSAEQTQQLAKDPANELNARLADDLLNANIRCVAAFDNAQLAGYSLFAANCVEPRHNTGGSNFHGIGIHLPLGVRFLFKAYVLPAYRGQGLQAAIVQAAFDKLDDDSWHSLVTTTEWTNQAYLRSIEKIGFKRCATAAEWVVAGRHHYKLPATIQLSDVSSANNPIASEQHAIRFFAGAQR